MRRTMRKGYLSHQRTAKSQASLCNCVVFPETSLLKHKIHVYGQRKHQTKSHISGLLKWLSLYEMIRRKPPIWAESAWYLDFPGINEMETSFSKFDACEMRHTVETELRVTQSALDVHMGCTPFVKD